MNTQDNYCYRPIQDQHRDLHICVPLHFGEHSAEILTSRPLTYKFNQHEINFLKKVYPKNKWVVKYAIITNQRFIDRHQGKRIMLLIDSHPQSFKNNGFETSFTVIATRPLVESEHDYMVGNFGCMNRRYVTWQFDTIEQLIVEDKSCAPQAAITPTTFISECQKLKLNRSYQTIIDFHV